MLAERLDGPHLKDALSRLSDEDRSAVLLKDRVGLSYDEMAQMLAIPRADARHRVARGRAALASLIDRGPNGLHSEGQHRPPRADLPPTGTSLGKATGDVSVRYAIGITATWLRWSAITMAFLNLGIHVYLAPAHLHEKFYIGVLFLVGSALLGFVAVSLASENKRVRRWAWIGGAATCTLEFVGFVLSRTSGLPYRYHETWAQKPEDLAGLASLAIEVMFVVAAVVALMPTGSTERPSQRNQRQRSTGSGPVPQEWR